MGYGYTIMCIAIENQYNAVRAPWVVLRGIPRFILPDCLGILVVMVAILISSDVFPLCFGSERGYAGESEHEGV